MLAWAKQFESFHDPVIVLNGWEGHQNVRAYMFPCTGRYSDQKLMGVCKNSNFMQASLPKISLNMAGNVLPSTKTLSTAVVGIQPLTTIFQGICMHNWKEVVHAVTTH